MKNRTILHCDMNNFYASVELLEHPELKDVPVAVCGNPEARHGIILAKNQLAKEAGVKTAETIWQAKKKSPDLHLLPPHHGKYSAFSKKINEIYLSYTDLVEPFSVDESWLDVTASKSLFGDGKTIADDIRTRVKKELGLTLSAGVSFNKIFAKMGSDYKKPDATTVIDRDNYKEILWPLPVGEMFFVGSAGSKKLNQMNIYTIGDLAACSRDRLEASLGKQGGKLWEYANAMDNEAVSPSSEKRKIKSVSHGITFRRNIKGGDEIRLALTALADKVSARLRRYNLKAGGIKVDIKDPSFKNISRQTKLTRPTNISEEIADNAFKLTTQNYGLTKEIRLITLAAINLCNPSEENEQLSFIQQEDKKDTEKMEAIDKTMDSIRNKFGNSSISYANIIQNDMGIDIDEEQEDDEYIF